MNCYSLACSLFAICTPMAVAAQPVTGLYINLGAGVSLLQDEVKLANPSIGSSFNNFYSFKPGFSSEVSFGYGLGNGLRAEIEGDFSSNNVDRNLNAPSTFFTHGTEHKYGGMANLLYDFSFGWPISPYFGLGIGGQIAEQVAFGQAPAGFIFPPGYRGTGTQSVGAFAYQAIVGASLPIASVPGLSLTIDYRFLGLVDPYPAYARTVYFANGGSATGKERFSNNYNHAIMFGLRYALYQPGVPKSAALAPSPVPAPPHDATYLVFFDWDSANLSDRGRQIIREAAQYATTLKSTRIMVNGYTDLSGTPRYNQDLSLRRARAVAEELVRDGIAKSEITMRGFGETHPLVPTAPGVREPQNRRVEIIHQ